MRERSFHGFRKRAGENFVVCIVVVGGLIIGCWFM